MILRKEQIYSCILGGIEWACEDLLKTGFGLVICWPSLNKLCLAFKSSFDTLRFSSLAFNLKVWNYFILFYFEYFFSFHSSFSFPEQEKAYFKCKPQLVGSGIALLRVRWFSLSSLLAHLNTCTHTYVHTHPLYA